MSAVTSLRVADVHIHDVHDVDEFLRYAQACNPDFLSRIEGATPEEIARLEAALDVEMPRDYHRWLELMGRSDDGLLFGDELVYSVAHMTEFYERDRVEQQYEVPHGCLAIGIGCIDLEIAGLDVDAPHAVYEVGNGERSTPWGASFVGFLHTQMFARATYKRYAHEVTLVTGDRTPRRALAESLVEAFDMQRWWFSDDVALCAESSGESLLCHQMRDRGLLLRLSTNRTVLRLREMAKRAQDVIGVKLERA